MATYVIGDVQGCYRALMQLLNKINFDIDRDKLVFCGDLVNRGGMSLQVLRWIYAHKQNCKVVLGNHDLSLLRQYYIPDTRKKKNKEFTEIFTASDCQLLMNWLVKQNLLIELKNYQTIVVHAGIYPSWSAKIAIKEAKFVEKYIQTKTIKFFKNMFGSKPNHWSKQLTGIDRARFAINAFTRMRYLFKNGGLNFRAKGQLDSFIRLIPWFKYKPKIKKKAQIIFGHWSALGYYNKKNVVCIDTGKVWGGKLTALKLNKSSIKSHDIYQV